MQKITPFLWYDDNASEAASFYTSVFRNSKMGEVTRYDEPSSKAAQRPRGSIMTVTFEIEGHRFIALNGGSIFKFNPTVSFLVACKTKEEVTELWEKLSEGGSALMPLGEYPFSERYGWTRDRYGVSWQMMFMGSREIKQRIIPTLMFVGDVCGKSEEAVNYYKSIFSNAEVGEITRYGRGEEPDREGTIKHVSFRLEGQEFAAMDSARVHDFAFNESLSFVVTCRTQEEVDSYWAKLTAGGDPKAQQCGWLIDRYGLSWQVVPAVLEVMLQDPDKERTERVTAAIMQMKKIDILELKKAYDGQLIRG